MEKFLIKNAQVERRGDRRNSKDSEAKETLTRRDFLKKASAAAGTGVVGAVGSKEYYEFLKTPEMDMVVPHDSIDSVVAEVVKEFSDSRYFNEAVAEKIALLEEQEADIEASRGVKTAVEHSDIINTILEHGQLPKIKSDIVRDQLERMLPAIAFTESRFDLDAFNEESGAFGPFQLMPEVWEELATADESLESLESHIKVAARLLEQAYQHITNTCRHELEVIEHNYFASNREEFEESFLLPVVVNAYFVGMGNMAEVLQAFAEDYKDPEELRNLSPEGVYLTGKDVFSGLTQAAVGLQWNPDYGEKSAEYPYVSFAAREVIEQSIADFIEQQRG
jgi:hypothetical protein